MLRNTEICNLLKLIASLSFAPNGLWCFFYAWLVKGDQKSQKVWKIHTIYPRNSGCCDHLQFSDIYKIKFLSHHINTESNFRLRLIIAPIQDLTLGFWQLIKALDLVTGNNRQTLVQIVGNLGSSPTKQVTGAMQAEVTKQPGRGSPKDSFKAEYGMMELSAPRHSAI